MISATIEERLESEAEFGLFFAYLKIGKNKAKELQDKGFEIIDSVEVNYFPRIHLISWQNTTVKECKDVQLLNENDPKYSFAQKLWIISMKNQPKTIQSN